VIKRIKRLGAEGQPCSFGNRKALFDGSVEIPAGRSKEGCAAEISPGTLGRHRECATIQPGRDALTADRNQGHANQIIGALVNVIAIRQAGSRPGDRYAKGESTVSAGQAA